MEFVRFLEIVPKITKLTLPGEAAHAKMSPPERLEKVKEIDFSVITPKQAAVLMLVYPKDGQATLALIERNSYKGVHSSQIAFPGGKIEPGDDSKRFTALRETEEEIGVARETVTVVGPFSELYIPPSNFCVAPFLGYCNQAPLFVPDPREVASIVELPLSVLLDERFTQLRRMPTSYSAAIDVPVFNVAGRDVWGATAMMLSELKEVLNAVGQPHGFL